MIEAVVLTLKVLWPSPPVPTMSHCVTCNISKAGKVKMGRDESYESTAIIPLTLPSSLHNTMQFRSIHLCGIRSHG